MLLIRQRITYGIRCSRFAAHVCKSLRFATRPHRPGINPGYLFECRVTEGLLIDDLIGNNSRTCKAVVPMTSSESNPDKTKDAALPREAMARRLVAGLVSLGQTLSEEQVEALLDYLAELVRWNKAYNLTAVTDPMAMVDRHIIDSLSIRPFIEGRRILDSGTGAGLPGVVLAVAEPDRHFILVDSNGKKVRFLRHIKRSLGLDNIEPIHARLESLELAPPPEEIVARALAPLARLIEWHRPWLEQGARLLAMKGQLEQAELDGMPDDYFMQKQTIEWGGMQAERCVAVVTRAG